MHARRDCTCQQNGVSTDIPFIMLHKIPTPPKLIKSSINLNSASFQTMRIFFVDYLVHSASQSGLPENGWRYGCQGNFKIEVGGDTITCWRHLANGGHFHSSWDHSSYLLILDGQFLYEFIELGRLFYFLFLNAYAKF